MLRQTLGTFYVLPNDRGPAPLNTALALMSDVRFRWLLVLYLLCMFAAVFAAFLPSGYSTEIDELIAKEPVPAILANDWAFLGGAAAFLAAVFTGLAGLFLFRRWGRTLSLHTTLVGFLVFPFFGPVVSSGLGSSLMEASSVLWGAVLACAYFSPASARFGARP